MTAITGHGPGFIDAFLRAVGVRSTETSTPGPEAIIQARRELTEDQQVDEARIGEARLADYSGEYDVDVKAVVPLHTSKYEDPAPLTFDVDGDQLADFCAVYDVDVESIGALEGATVPLRWESGTPVPDWPAMTEEDAPDLSSSISGIDGYDQAAGTEDL